MKVSKSIVLLGALLILALGTAASDEGLKVGVVDIDQAISSTDKGKAAREEFARKQREAQAKIQPMIDKYTALEEELKAKKFVLSDEALFQKQLDLVEMRNQIQSRMKEIEGEMQVAQKRIEGPLIARLGLIIEELGKSQGFTLIIRRGAPGVLYTREALDITDIVIEKYNQKS
jgi:outer membrane protein